MSDDKADLVTRGRQAAAIEEPLKIAGERVKDVLAKHMLNCAEHELGTTRRAILITDQLVLALQNVMNDGKQAERELHDLETGRHRIYSIA